MAELVLGVGTSHSPILSINSALWPVHAELDRVFVPDYDTRILNPAPRWLVDELSAQKWEQKHRSCQIAITTLGNVLVDADPDVILIVGDDQHEMFHDENMPMFAIFRGDSLVDEAVDTSTLPPTIRAANWARHGETDELYPSDPQLAEHVIRFLVASDFDLSTVKSHVAGRTLGHAFTFIPRRLLVGSKIKPIIPVIINTYYPPNTPSPSRCVELGKSISEAIESYPKHLRVAVVASGGLSHHVIDEEFDRKVIGCLERGDLAAMSTLPPEKMVLGTSETLNWLTAGAALSASGLTMELVDYVPTYRSLVGSGVGCTFGIWR